MKLVKVELRPGQIILAACQLCGESTRNSINGELFADVDGAPFSAYYHGECAERVKDRMVASGKVVKI